MRRLVTLLAALALIGGACGDDTGGGESGESGSTYDTVTDQYVEAHPGGEADQSAFLEELGDLSNRLGVPFIDAHAWGTERDFADTHHLNGQAADRFSAEMVGRLEGSGVALPRC
jgi:hypothetical protein